MLASDLPPTLEASRPTAHWPVRALSGLRSLLSRRATQLTMSYPWQRATVVCGRNLNWVRPRNFLLLGAVRSGTTLLVDYLNCHRNIRCRGEIIGEAGERYGDPWRMERQRLLLHVESLFVKRPGILAGAKILTYHLDELPLTMTDVVELLDRPKVIALYREKILEQYLSLKLAERSGLWHLTKPAKNEPIHLDPASFLAYMERERRMWQQSLQVLDGRQVHYVSYEQLTAQPGPTMRGVFEFLGVKPCPVQSRLIKVNPEPLSRKLANYREFVEQGIRANAKFQLPFSEPSQRTYVA